MGYDFSIIMLPDSQGYAINFGTVFTQQCQWIADNADAHKIGLVLHVGDITRNGSVPAQWVYMATGKDILAASGIPTLWAIGNHDYDLEDWASRLSVAFDAWLPETWYTGKPWWSGGFYNSPAEHVNYWFTMTQGDHDWIVVVLEVFPRDPVIAWADGILTAHADKTAIVLTHSELHYNNYRMEGRLWHDCMKAHSNIAMCLCGHIANDGGGFLAESTGLGNVISTIMADYSQQNYGNGWLREIRVNQACRAAWMDAYSVTLDIFRTHPDHSREFSW